MYIAKDVFYNLLHIYKKSGNLSGRLSENLFADVNVFALFLRGGEV